MSLKKENIHLVFLGPPFSGKGTQSSLLGDKYNFAHISGGDLLRREKTLNTPRSQLCKEKSWNKFQLSELCNELIEEELQKAKKEGKGYILDGILKSTEGISELNGMLQRTQFALEGVIYFEIDKNILCQRIQAGTRLIHPKSGRIYHSSLIPPKVPKKDDLTGEDLETREDDGDETRFLQRYQNFISHSKPILEFYNNLGKLHIVDANQEPQILNKTVVEIIEKIKASNVSPSLSSTVWANPFLQILEKYSSVLRKESVVISEQIRKKVVELCQIRLQKGDIYRFPGQKEAGLSRSDLEKLNDKDYTVSPKLDGIRQLCYLNAGCVYFLDRKMQVYSLLDISLKKNYSHSLLDGELVESSKSELHFIAFDCMSVDDTSIISTSFSSRLEELKKIVPNLCSKSITFSIQHYYPPSQYDKALMDYENKFELDGLIFYPTNEYLPKLNRNCFKWKPLAHLTADFVLRKDKLDSSKYYLCVLDDEGYFSVHSWITSKPSNKDYDALCNHVVECKFDKNSKSEFWNSKHRSWIISKGSWIPLKIRSDRTNPNPGWLVHSIEQYLKNPIKEADLNFFLKKQY